MENTGFSPGDVFPTDEDVKSSLSLILENSALFADLALRLPDVTLAIYKSKNEFRVLMDWGLNFSNSTGFFDEITTKLMHLAGQELGLVEKDPNFTNPYRKSKMGKKKGAENKENAVNRDEKLKKKKEKNKRGPSLGGKSHAEL